MARIPDKVRAEAIEALLTVASERTRGGWSLISDWTTDAAWDLAYAAWVLVASVEDMTRRREALIYGAAASLLDAGWSPP